MFNRPIDPLLDARDAAEVLKVHRNTVLDMLRAGILPGLRLGRYWRLRAVDLDNWLAARARKQSESTAYPELSSQKDESI